ncbi:MAG: metallophosphatase family protein [Chloroflexota bacterium]|nr:metallophosphatase family protein [Chloroflexota bacterium]
MAEPRSLLDDPAWPTDQRVFTPPLTIGVVSDTHVMRHGVRRLPPEVTDLFRRFGVGLIVHAGDVNTGAVLDALAEVAPVIAVTGNNDDRDLMVLLDREERFTVGPHRFVLVHGHGGRSARSEARRLAGDADCVVYGHSHVPMIEKEDETILFNPGSATDRRWQEEFSVGLLTVTAETILPELVLYGDPRYLVNVKP